MRHITNFNPRRMAYAGAFVAANATQAAYVALFNNSPYAEYLLIRDWTYGPGGLISALATVTQGNLGGTVAPLTAYIPTDAPPPGIFTFGTQTTILTQGYVLFVPANSYQQWPHDMPFAIVPPGWSFVIQQSAVNNNMRGSVMYQAIMPADLDSERFEDANLQLALNPQGTAN